MIFLEKYKYKWNDNHFPKYSKPQLPHFTSVQHDSNAIFGSKGGFQEHYDVRATLS